MASVNKVILVGYVGREPEPRNTRSGLAITGLIVATSSFVKKANGERAEETEWHRVTVFGKAAEFALSYLHKGSLVYVEGRIRTRSYERDGVKQTVTEIVSDVLQSLDRKAASAGTETRQSAKPAQASSAAQDMTDDEIPF